MQAQIILYIGGIRIILGPSIAARNCIRRIENGANMHAVFEEAHLTHDPIRIIRCCGYRNGSRRTVHCSFCWTRNRHFRRDVVLPDYERICNASIIPEIPSCHIQILPVPISSWNHRMNCFSRRFPDSFRYRDISTFLHMEPECPPHRRWQ
jgi:hypothetical protein